MNIDNSINNVLVAIKIREPKQERSSSFTGRLWTHFIDVAKSSPTSVPIFNLILKITFVALAVTPYLILTVGTIYLDFAVMTGKTLAYIYNSIKNRITDKPASNSEKTLKFLNKNKVVITLGVTTIAAVAVKYKYNNEISDKMNKIISYLDFKLAKNKIGEVFQAAKCWVTGDTCKTEEVSYFSYEYVRDKTGEVFQAAKCWFTDCE